MNHRPAEETAATAAPLRFDDPVDLHLHTLASDGAWTPEELIAHLAVHGFRVVAVCDHDTQRSVAEAIRLGADGLLGEDGALHRLGLSQQQTGEATRAAAESDPVTQHMVSPAADLEMTSGEPVLSADELRALLREEPSVPPDGES